jgi:putative RNA 2'-phosphotransferase
MATPRLVRISKLLALILRHRPDQFGIVLDGEGYADLREVLAAVQTRLPGATLADLTMVVREVEPEKSRYRIEDGGIRANYGHSLAGRIAQEPGVPPALLWHGTPDHALEAIARQGLLPMRRQYVHLTTSRELATRIGARHGAPRTLKVDAARAHADGLVFYWANDAFWLSGHIPPGYITV